MTIFLLFVALGLVVAGSAIIIKRRYLFGVGVLFSAIIPIIAAVAISDNPAAVTAERAACLADAQCLTARFSAHARARCEAAVTAQATHKATWASASDRYDVIAAYNAAKHQIILTGHGVTFQNGFGADVPVKFTCLYDAKADKIDDVSVETAKN